MSQRLRTDWILFFTVLGMVCFGLVMVYSTSMVAHTDGQHGSEAWSLFARQFAWAIVSLLVLAYTTKQDYRKWNHPMWAFLCLGVVVLLLVVVYVLDSKSHRWVRFGAFSLQPSEFAKPALALFLAFFLARRL